MLIRNMSGLSERGRIERLISAVGATRLLGILVVASVVLPALLFAAFSYLSYQAHVRAAETRLVQTLYVVHEHIGKVFETHQLAVLHVRDLLRDRGDEDLRRNVLGLRARLSELKAALPQVRDIWIIDADGYLVASAVIKEVPRDINFADREHFRVHREGFKGSYISDVLRARLGDSDAFFVLSQRWSGDQGKFRGIVAISVEPSYFHAFFSGFPEGNALGLVKEDGSVLAHYPRIAGRTETRLPQPAGGNRARSRSGHLPRSS
jgi:two-component system NtrC family sensor kinase